jgi:RimJ/RimL family protein N-acetyltransferase
MTPPIIETERLILRPVMAEDFEPLCAMMADAEVARFIGGVQAPSMVWRSLCALRGAWDIRGYSMFSIIEKASGQWLGRMGPWYPEGWPGPEVGWGLIAAAQGKGYATESASAVMDYCVGTLGWREIIHCIDKDNLASIKVAERLGSFWLREAIAPEPIKDVVWQLYGQSADDWRARRAG